MRYEGIRLNSLEWNMKLKKESFIWKTVVSEPAKTAGGEVNLVHLCLILW